MSDIELATAKLAIINQSCMRQKEAKAARVREAIERVVALSIVFSIGLTLFFGGLLLLVAVILFWGLSIVIYILGKTKIKPNTTTSNREAPSSAITAW